MDDTEIYDKLTPIFQEVFDDDTLIPTAEMTANDVEEWDSLSHIRLIVAVEEFFKIKFSSAEVGELEIVAEFVALIESKL